MFSILSFVVALQCEECAPTDAMRAGQVCCEQLTSFLPDDDFARLQKLTEHLPVDPYLPNRFKLIGFVQFTEAGEITWDVTERGHFLIGNAAYKDVDGGDAGERYYEVFPEELRGSQSMANLLRRFRNLCGEIPTESVILVQAQRTQYIHKHVELDVTYEGVHSGGACQHFKISEI